MSPAEAKRMGQAIITALTLDRLRTAHQLDEDGAGVLEAAKRDLERYAPRDLVAGFLGWQASGMIRRDPRPRPTTDTGVSATGEEARIAATLRRHGL